MDGYCSNTDGFSFGGNPSNVDRNFGNFGGGNAGGLGNVTSTLGGRASDFFDVGSNVSLSECMQELSERGLGPMRSWSEFGERFSLPKDKYFDRIRVNVCYYTKNYALILAVSSAVILFLYPMAIIAFGVIVAGFIYVNKNPIVISGRPLTEQQKQMGLMTLSSLIIYFSGSSMVLMMIIGLGGGLCLCHAIARPPSVKSKFSDLKERAGSSMCEF